tara:strand:- start:267 stop:458 length:192 start_codon:yes stop_codon:yes gene_type:complete
MRILALSVSILSIAMFISMIAIMFIADRPVTEILEIKGYGATLIGTLTCGIGLLLAAYEGEWR